MRELSLHILDMLENALEAGATQVIVRVDEDLVADRLSIMVQDDGCGMEANIVRQALDPFYTTRSTRQVGLGLPLLAAAARRCAGDVVIESEPGRGTKVVATFQHSHLDRAPLGNMADTVVAFLLSEEGNAPRLDYAHRRDCETFELDTAAVKAVLGEIPFSYPDVRDWLRDYIIEGEAELRSG